MFAVRVLYPLNRLLNPQYFLFLFPFSFWDGLFCSSHLTSPGWPRNQCVHQADLDLTEVCLPLLFKCLDQKYVPTYLALVFFSSLYLVFTLSWSLWHRVRTPCIVISLEELIGSCICVPLVCDLRFCILLLWLFGWVSVRKLVLDFIGEPLDWWKSLLNHHVSNNIPVKKH